MTTSEKSCFVYVQLPGTLDVVTCGKFVLDRSVGRFIYRRGYLEDPRSVELDKFELPLRSGTFETARLNGIFGALRDASPDSWGRRIIERFMGRSDLGEVDYLLNSPEDRAGALSFGRSPTPPAPIQRFNQVIRLRELLDTADAFDTNSPVPPQIEKLLQPGTSLGGARPKNVVEDPEGLWVAKFPAQRDRWNYAAVEGAMLQLARECGLRSAFGKMTRVGGRDVLLVKRFDREKVTGGHLRYRMVSALTVLRADEAVQDRISWSYQVLADEVARWSEKPDEDLQELFGRMAFNALISNTDDHPRNHALIAAGLRWRLSPAYDLVPTPHSSTDRRDLALEIGLHGRWANRANLISACSRFRLSTAQANGMIDHIAAKVAARWRDLALSAGASETDCRTIEPAFNYSGFEQ